MKKIFLFLVICLFNGQPTIVWADDARQAVVKVFVNSNDADYYRPWQSKGTQASSGSGTVIAGNQILTNAHVVSDATFIQVRKESDPKKYTAKVQAVGTDCDLAILTVEDPSFFQGIKPFVMDGLPELQDSVTVIGFPQGGDKISITEGVISRVEVIPYVQSTKRLLAVQIDAAINPGNSGGPVIQKGKLVGIAMQAMMSSQNIGYMIPTTVIQHFLKDLEDGHYHGFPLVGIDYLSTENAALRQYYQAQNVHGGVLVTYVMPYSSGDGIIEPGDVLLEIDGVAIGVDGTYEFRKNERLNFSQLIQNKQIGEEVHVQLIRNGKKMDVPLPFKPYVGLIPYPNYFTKPPYFIYGGMVFTVLSHDLLQSFGNEWWQKAPIDFLHYLIGKGRLNAERKKEIVVLLEVLPDDVNVGYHDYHDDVIRKVNGQEFSSFEEFVSAIRKGKNGKFTVFETDQKLPIIIQNDNIDQIDHDIILRNNIPAQYSADVSKWFLPE